MPWDIQKKGKTFFVTSKITGKVMGHHKTMAEARDQQKALYANMPKIEAKMHMNGSFSHHNPKPNPKAKLGQGGRFAAIEAKAKAGGAKNPAAVAAAAGFAKYGKTKMLAMARAGKHA